MKHYIILNPTSGRGNAGKLIPRIEELLHSFHLDFDLIQTKRPWHAAELAEAAARASYDVVVTASGDGTANEAVNGLMRARADGFDRTAFSILPVGTGNDMLYGIGHHDSLENGVRALAEDHRRRIDVGLVRGGDYPEGRYFANGVGIGFDAQAGFEAAKIRWATGLLVYLLAVIRTLLYYFNSPKVEITVDGESFLQPSLMTSIMNGRRLGGGFMIAPEGAPDDGWFDLCVASEASRLRLFQLIPHFLKGTHTTQPEVKMYRARKASIRAIKGDPLPAHADGETLCVSGSELSVELIPSALEIVTLKPV